MSGEGVQAGLIRQKFQLAVPRYGLNGLRREVDLSLFRSGGPLMALF